MHPLYVPVLCRTCVSRLHAGLLLPVLPQHRGQEDTGVTCSQCREIFLHRSLWPDRQQGSLVATLLCPLQPMEALRAWLLCSEHLMALSFFCQEGGQRGDVQLFCLCETYFFIPTEDNLLALDPIMKVSYVLLPKYWQSQGWSVGTRNSKPSIISPLTNNQCQDSKIFVLLKKC